MPAYLQSGFFMGTPLVLIKEAERAERYDPAWVDSSQTSSLRYGVEIP
jgi:hypothetical protein